jgi:uncharacterized protein YndB with AHSA1/START domain
MNANLDVAKAAEGDVVVTRVYDAPREVVFRAWTDPEQLMRWWAPNGCTTPFCTVDLRPGGKFHYCMRLPDGRDIWGLGIYDEIVAPERIVYTDAFADADGNPVSPSRYGMSAGYPTESVVTVALAKHPRGTMLTLRHSVGAVAFAERGGMEQGWNEMLEHLAEDLAHE